MLPKGWIQRTSRRSQQQPESVHTNGLPGLNLGSVDAGVANGRQKKKKERKGQPYIASKAQSSRDTLPPRNKAANLGAQEKRETAIAPIHNGDIFSAVISFTRSLSRLSADNAGFLLNALARGAMLPAASVFRIARAYKCISIYRDASFSPLAPFPLRFPLFLDLTADHCRETLQVPLMLQ